MLQQIISGLEAGSWYGLIVATLVINALRYCSGLTRYGFVSMSGLSCVG